MKMSFIKAALASIAISASSFASAGLITHQGSDWTEATTPAFGTLTTSVDEFFIDYGVDYTFGNTEGVFVDPPNALCGINSSGDCDLLTAVDGRIVDLGTTNQSSTSFISVVAGSSAQGTLLLEVFDLSMNLLGSATNTANGASAFSVDRNGAFDIAYFRVSGNDTWGLRSVTIESPLVAQVTEPSTFAILMLSMLGLASRRFRSNK